MRPAITANHSCSRVHNLPFFFEAMSDVFTATPTTSVSGGPFDLSPLSSVTSTPATGRTRKRGSSYSPSSVASSPRTPTPSRFLKLQKEQKTYKNITTYVAGVLVEVE